MLFKPRLSLPALARWARCQSHVPSGYTLSQQMAQLTKEVQGLDPEAAERKIASSVIHGRSAYEPFYHPRPYGVPVALVQFQSYVPQFLDFFAHFASHAASALGIPISRAAKLPTQRTLWTVPSGPFVHKKSQENFERKVHKRAIKAYDADPEVVERWLRYLQKHSIATVGFRMTRWERVPVGVGNTLLQNAKDRIRIEGLLSDAQKVKALSEQIIQQESQASSQGAIIPAHSASRTKV